MNTPTKEPTNMQKVKAYLIKGLRLTVVIAIKLDCGTELRSILSQIKRDDPEFGARIKSEPVKKGSKCLMWFLEKAA